MILKQINETSIVASWTLPEPVGSTTNYRLYWANCTTNWYMRNETFNTSITTKTLTNLTRERCYNISVAGLSEHLPSAPESSTITLGQSFFLEQLSCIDCLLCSIVTRPGTIYIDVTSTSSRLLLMVSLRNYIENGVYNITTTVTWVRFLHHCANGDDMDNIMVIEQPFNMSPIEQSITGLPSNSQYNITVVITNIIGNATAIKVNKTMEAGNCL